MANLQEVVSWEAGIYQLETGDPVLGGPGGISNKQAQALANRTAYLKKHVDDIEGGNTAAGKANKLSTARTIALAGDVTGQAAFDGSGNITITATYKNSGVVAGTYRSVTVDAKGNITAGTNPTTLAGYGITDAATKTELGTVQTGLNNLGGGTTPAGKADKLSTARTIALAGDVTGQAAFDGSGNISITTTYKNSGVTAGTYRSVTVDAKGNITAGSNPTTLTGYGITDALPATGTAAAAQKLATARTIALAGDVTGQANFDGSGNISITATYKNSGVTAGTYRSVTVDAKGNITGGTNPTTLAGYGITDALPTNAAFGVGQSWQNVLANRALNVIYTNSTGRPILVAASTLKNDSLGNQPVIQVDGVDAFTGAGVSAAGVSAMAVVSSVSAIVPNGSTYKIVQSGGGSGSIVLAAWAELR